METALPSTPPSPKRRAKFLVGGTLIALILVGLVVWALGRPGSTSLYRTTSELATAGTAPLAAGSVRVNGTVVPGSIESQGLITSFQITDGGTELTVTTDQPLPDAFQDGSEVVATGTYDGSRFAASEVLAKCPSKFKAKA